MRLTLFSALTLSKGGTGGQTPYGGATGQGSEGSTNERKAPARPASK